MTIWSKIKFQLKFAKFLLSFSFSLDSNNIETNSFAKRSALSNNNSISNFDVSKSNRKLILENYAKHGER